MLSDNPQLHSLNAAHDELAQCYARYLETAKQLPLGNRGHAVMSLQGGWMKLVQGHQELTNALESEFLVTQ